MGYADLALRYFHESLFLDLTDSHHNTADGVHVAACGGVWLSLVCGFGGMRDHAGRITLDPRLPRSWSSLVYSLTLAGARVLVTTTHQGVQLDLVEGEQAELHVRERRCVLSASTPSIMIEAEGEPLVLHDAPISPALRGERRADGSLLTASIPAAMLPA